MKKKYIFLIIIPYIVAVFNCQYQGFLSGVINKGTIMAHLRAIKRKVVISSVQ